MWKGAVRFARPFSSRQWRLVGLVCTFVILAMSYSLVTPLFEAPDEVWHYAYVRWLAEGHGLPALEGDHSGANQEAAQPPLYYAVAALFSLPFDDAELSSFLWHNPGFGYQAPGAFPDNKNMLIHTSRERWPWPEPVLAVRAARLASLLFGGLTLLAVWGIGRELSDDLAATATAIVAFWPQFLFLSGVVSNDTAAAATASFALWGLMRIVRRGATPRRALLTGLSVGLAMEAKASNILLLPLAVATLLWVGWRDRLPARRWATLTLGLLLVAVVVGGGWYIRNAWCYGDPLGTRAHTQTPWRRDGPADLPTLLADLPLLYRSFWGAFGWGHVFYPALFYIALGGLPALSFGGWIVRLRTERTSGARRGFLLPLIWGTGVFAALVRWMRLVEAPHGRLLFPAIGAFAVLMAGGWKGLRRRWVVNLCVGGLAALSVTTPWTVIRPAFAPPRLRDPAEVAATVGGPTLTFDGKARLLGGGPLRESVAPGQWLDVRACWEAVSPMERDYTVFVQLIGKGMRRVGERLTYPGLGRFPTSLWVVGRAFCDRYRLRVEPWAETPELYDVIVGLYDAETGRRLDVRDAAGRAVGLPVVGQVRVAPATPPPYHPTYTTDYRLGESIALVGYDLGELRSGEPFTVTFYWRAEAPIGESYTVFVHLLGPDGAMVSQDDRPPRDGRYPTFAWRRGEVIPDTHRLDVPPGVTVGGLRLGVGMYRPDTLARLPVRGPQGDMPDAMAVLEVQP